MSGTSMAARMSPGPRSAAGGKSESDNAAAQESLIFNGDLVHLFREDTNRAPPERSQ